MCPRSFQIRRLALCWASLLALPLAALPQSACVDARFRIGDQFPTGYCFCFLFLSGPQPDCEDAADADDSGSLNLTDAVYTLVYLFLSGPSPSEPFPACGLDPTADGLTCKSSKGCVEP